MLTVCNYHYIRQDFSFKYPSIFGVTPDEFDRYRQIGLDLGFRHVESGALVRSSYKAHKHIE